MNSFLLVVFSTFSFFIQSQCILDTMKVSLNEDLKKNMEYIFSDFNDSNSSIDFLEIRIVEGTHYPVSASHVFIDENDRIVRVNFKNGKKKRGKKIKGDFSNELISKVNLIETGNYFNLCNDFLKGHSTSIFYVKNKGEMVFTLGMNSSTVLQPEMIPHFQDLLSFLSEL